MAESKKISFLFEKAKDHRTVAVNGAFGGTSPDSKTVVANLYVESVTTPNIMTAQLENGKLKPGTEERISKSDAVREIQTTIVLSPENAVQLGQFLIEKGKLALKNRSRNG